MSATLVEVAILFVLILANGFFAMSEIALVSSRKVRLQQRAEDGDRRAKRVLRLIASPNRFLSTVQIGISLVSTLAGAFGGATLADKLAISIERIPALRPYAHGIALVLVVLAITYFSLVIGELIPKRIAMNDPERVALSSSGFMRFLSQIASPVVSLLSASTDLGVRLLGIRPSTEPPVTEDEIKVLVEQGTQVGVFQEVEQDIIESVLRLGDRRVDAIMTPRTEIVWLDLDEPYEDNLREVRESGHSRFPVAQGDLDNVLGILKARDLLESTIGVDQPVDLRKLLRPPLFVPESTPAFKVMENLRASREHMALIVDEYGGLQGMVTLFDILEAIIGALPGQGSAEEPAVVQREDGSWLMDGLLPIDEVKEIIGVDELPGEDRVGFQTLGGFVMSQLGHIPAPGQHFDWGGFRFEVADMDSRRVDKVLVIPQKEVSSQ